MPWNLMLLPLIGGYLFARTFLYTRYRAGLLEGHRLLIEGAAYGFLLLALARLTTANLRDTGFGRQLEADWIDVVGRIPWSATCTGALLLGFGLPKALNSVIYLGFALRIWRNESLLPEESAEPDEAGEPRLEADHSITRTDSTESSGSADDGSKASRFRTDATRLLLRCRQYLVDGKAEASAHALATATAAFDDHIRGILRRSVREQRPVLITLRGGKVYVGLVTAIGDSSSSQGVVLLVPIASGYRGEELRVIFTTRYPKPREVPEDDLQIAVPIETIESARLFSESLGRQGYFQLNLPARGEGAGTNEDRAD